MSLRDLALALLVVTLWGANFTVIRLSLEGVPPLLLAALRYALAAFPFIFFIRPPAVAGRYWVAYGLTAGLSQFACLFTAIHAGLPAGLASVILQSQVLFTTAFAWLFLGEPVTRAQLVGLAVAVAGLGLVATGEPALGSQPIPAGAFGLALAAAASWGISNVIIRLATASAQVQGTRLDMFSVVVWSSLIPPLPLLALAFALGETASLVRAITTLKPLSAFAVAFQAYGATLVGAGLWSSLMGRYPASQVAPLSLLVPLTGLLTAYLVLGEHLSLIQGVGCATALAGLALSLLARSRREPAQARIRQGTQVAAPIQVDQGHLPDDQLLGQRHLGDDRHPGRVQGDDDLHVNRYLKEDPVEGLVDARRLEGGPGRHLH